MRQRVESGERTYSEPSKRHHRQHLISKRMVDGHLVWTIAPRQNASNKRWSMTGCLAHCPKRSTPSLRLLTQFRLTGESDERYIDLDLRTCLQWCVYYNPGKSDE
jgi:hypothetical protein